MKLLAYLPPLPPFLFAALVVGGLASKALHIALHIHSLPFLYFVLYSPTLVIPDLLVIAFVRVLLYTPFPETKLQWVTTCLGGLLSYVNPSTGEIQMIGISTIGGHEKPWD
jgi:hypothetical protein